MSYDLLDEILYRIDYNLGYDKLDKDLVEKVLNMMLTSKHKGKMPPMYKIS